MKRFVSFSPLRKWHLRAYNENYNLTILSAVYNFTNERSLNGSALSNRLTKKKCKVYESAHNRYLCNKSENVVVSRGDAPLL